MNRPNPPPQELEAQLSEPVESCPPRPDELRAEIMRQVRTEQVPETRKTPQPVRIALFAAMAAAACLAIAFILADKLRNPRLEPALAEKSAAEWSLSKPSFPSQAEAFVTSPYREQSQHLSEDLMGLGTFLNGRFDFVDSLLPAEDPS